MDTMPRKKIAVITMDDRIVDFYAQQLRSLFGEFADILTYNTKDGSADNIAEADIYAVSTCAFQNNSDAERFFSMDGVVLLKMTITRANFDLLCSLPLGTKAMMVNLSLPMAIETMVLLNQLGIKNIEFAPVYPGMDRVPDLDLAITPAEGRFVPPGVEEVIDIGHRFIDANTMIEIALKLGCEKLLEERKFVDYIDGIVSNDYSFRQVFGRSLQLESQVSILSTILDIGLIGVDATGRVSIFNQKAEYVLDLRSEDAVGKPSRETIPYIGFDEFAAGTQTAKTHLARINGIAVNVKLTRVVRNGQYVGAFAVVERFEDEEQKQHQMRRQLMNRGYTTKYRFEDIKGQSASIQNAVRIAKKMAATNSSVLISGESGTGKELFAHAIHHASPRSKNPFVAINCAAIPDSLFESELFGYEEGAFTGAKKGGKPGLFELAHGGTLFLDEIEGVSQTLQVKLLRAIQEKEVLRIGDYKIRNVDVRIIAATNEDLVQMVKAGKFRKDLYYRLNTLPLQLPPLRQRQDDIIPLIKSIGHQLGGDFSLSPEATDILRSYAWDGNIRELRNCVEYLLYTGDKIIDKEDLPPFFPAAAPGEREADDTVARFCERLNGEREDFIFVLKELEAASMERRAVGRKSLSDEARRRGLFLTEHEIRRILVVLEGIEAVRLSKGRGGSRITSVGRNLLSRLLDTAQLA